MIAQSRNYALVPVTSDLPAEHDKFTLLEVHPCVENPDGCERIPDGEPLPAGAFYTLYGFSPLRLWIAIGDFSSFEFACEVARMLGGEPVEF